MKYEYLLVAIKPGNMARVRKAIHEVAQTTDLPFFSDGRQAPYCGISIEQAKADYTLLNDLLKTRMRLVKRLSDRVRGLQKHT